MKPLLFPLICTLFLCSCQSGRHHGEKRPTGTVKRKTEIKFKGQKRGYRFFIPENMAEENWPLVVVLHGAFNTAKGIEKQSGFNKLAEEKGFCAAYPNGIGVFGLLQHWNAGHCCGKALSDNIDDVAYLNAVLDDLLAHYPIDPNRIYFVGYSNGGMMVYRYAAECTARLAGAAVVSGAINSDGSGWCLPEPTRPLPVMIIHGTADRAIPIDGGPSPDKPDGNRFAPLVDAVEFWESRNGTNAPVRVEILSGWGHSWPGTYFDSPDFEAAEAIWDFFNSISP